MTKMRDYTGERYGKLTVLEYVATKRYRNGRATQWLCQCDCGNKTVVDSVSLKTGNTVSCGCHRRELSSKRMIERNKTHGITIGSEEDKRLYRLWAAIKRRCYYEKCVGYHNYGGRGVRMCDEWKNEAAKFVEWCKSHGYKKGLEIDRINNNGNYEPNNCQFISKVENEKKKRNTIWLTIDGISKVCADWNRLMEKPEKYYIQRIYRKMGEEYAINVIRNRLNELGKEIV